jgi:hypothetical protein
MSVLPEIASFDPSKLSMVVYKLNCLTEGCDASYIGESKRICNIRMEDHANYPKSHVHEHHKLPGHKMDFENVEILDGANTTKKHLLPFVPKYGYAYLIFHIFKYS